MVFVEYEVYILNCENYNLRILLMVLMFLLYKCNLY